VTNGRPKWGWANPEFAHAIRLRTEEVIRNLDPIGLLATGCPPDEYDGEINHIVAKLVMYRSAPPVDELRSLLRDTFVKAFDDRIAGPASAYSEAAAAIANLWTDD